MTTQRYPLVGAFADRGDAERAVDGLREAGWRDEDIGFVSHDRRDADAGDADVGTDTGLHGTAERAAAGAGTGAVAGGILGALAAGLIPGIGPIVAGGVLAGLVGGAVIGGGVGAVAGALTGMGVPEDEARYYEDEFRSGRTLVTVQAGDRYDEAYAILARNGGRLRSTATGRTVEGTEPYTDLGRDAYPEEEPVGERRDEYRRDL